MKCGLFYPLGIILLTIGSVATVTAQTPMHQAAPPTLPPTVAPSTPLQPANPNLIKNMDIMAQLFLVFKQSIQQTITDKNYWLSLLARMNAVHDELSNYLQDLTNNYDLQVAVNEANRRGIAIYVNYLIQVKPRNLFYFADGTKLSFSDFQAINSAIQRGDFASIQAMTACPAGTTKCGNSCVNLKTDFYNCGYCGRVCARGLVCRDGKCMQPGIQTPILR
jgi:hypothetical protein